MLAKLSSIRIPLDVEGKITDVEVSINLSDYLEDGIYLVDKDVVINAKCNIVKLGTKELEILPTDISLNNKSDKFNYEFAGTEKLVVTLSGLSDKLKDVGISDIAPYIDLSNVKEAGNYSYVLKFKDIEGVKIGTTKALTIRVTEANTTGTASSGAIDEATGTAVDTKDMTDKTKEPAETKETGETKEDASTSGAIEEGKSKNE